MLELQEKSKNYTKKIKAPNNIQQEILRGRDELFSIILVNNVVDIEDDLESFHIFKDIVYSNYLISLFSSHSYDYTNHDNIKNITSRAYSKIKEDHSAEYTFLKVKRFRNYYGDFAYNFYYVDENFKVLKDV